MMGSIAGEVELLNTVSYKCFKTGAKLFSFMGYFFQGENLKELATVFYGISKFPKKKKKSVHSSEYLSLKQS